MTEFLAPATIGALLFALLCLLLAIKCFQVARKERVERRCLKALGTVLLVPALGGLAAPVEHFWWASLTAGLGTIVLAFAGFFLAVSGLRRFRRKRAHFDRGRNHGIAALVLSGGLVGIFLFFTAIGVVDGVSRTKKLQTVFEQESDGESYLLRDFNLSFAPLDESWITIDPKAVNAVAELALTRKRNESYLMVIPELPGADSGFSLETLGQGVLANLRSSNSDASWEPPEPLEIAGIEGQSFTARSRVGLVDVHYEYWYGLRNGIAVQVIGWGPQDQQEALREAHRNFLNGMQLFDPDKVFVANGELIEGRLDFETEGFSVDLPKAEWIHAEPGMFEEVGFRATGLGGGQLNVVRVDFGEIETEIDLEALSHGFSASQNVGIEDSAIIEKRDRELPDGTKVRDLVVWFEEGDWRFRDYFRFYRSGTQVLIVNTWNEVNDADPAWDAAQVLDSVRFHGNPQALEYAWMTEERRAALAGLVNKTGLYYFARDRFQPAAELFASAAKIDPENAVFARNEVEALLGMEKFEDSLAAIGLHLKRFPDDLGGVALRAETLAKLAQIEASLQLYEELFDGDFSDDDVLLDYLNLLINEGQQVKALMVIEQEVADRPSRKLRLWEGQVAVVAREFRQAEKAFRLIGESDGWDSRLFGEMVDLFQTEGNHDAAWEWLDKQEQQMGPTFDVWMGRGRSQLALGKLMEAHVSFSQALDRRPGDPDAEHYLDEVMRKVRLEKAATTD